MKRYDEGEVRWVTMAVLVKDGGESCSQDCPFFSRGECGGRWEGLEEGAGRPDDGGGGLYQKGARLAACRTHEAGARERGSA